MSFIYNGVNYPPFMQQYDMAQEGPCNWLHRIGLSRGVEVQRVLPEVATLPDGFTFSEKKELRKRSAKWGSS